MRNCKATLSKRAMASVDTAVVDVWQREVGELSNRKFANNIAASQDIVLRLDISRRLENDQDRADSAGFNADGNLLVYGGLSDKRIKIWDWEAGIAKLTLESGHVWINHFFVAKFMPGTGDRSLITCAADGQVRHAQISDRSVKTRMVAKHIAAAGAYDLAVEPGSPHIFYSCGADGLVNHIDLRTAAATKLFKCPSIDDRRLDFTPLYHMAVDPMNPEYLCTNLGVWCRSPHLIYTCGEDGLVQHIDLRTAVATELLRCQPIGGCRVRNPVISLYAMAIDPRNPNVFAVVGSDQYTRLYDICKYKCDGSTDFG
ncbi:hypothetical protein V6N13_124567 [Hibiscus sabdariffa]